MVNYARKIFEVSLQRPQEMENFQISDMTNCYRSRFEYDVYSHFEN